MVVSELEIITKITITIIGRILAVFQMLCRDVISELNAIPTISYEKRLGEFD